MWFDRLERGLGIPRFIDHYLGFLGVGRSRWGIGGMGCSSFKPSVAALLMFIRTHGEDAAAASEERCNSIIAYCSDPRRICGSKSIGSSLGSCDVGVGSDSLVFYVDTNANKGFRPGGIFHV